MNLSSLRISSRTALITALITTTSLISNADAVKGIEDHRREPVQHKTNWCTKAENRKWWIFMLSSLGTLVIGVLIILLFRGLVYIFRRLRSGPVQRTGIAPGTFGGQSFSQSGGGNRSGNIPIGPIRGGSYKGGNPPPDAYIGASGQLIGADGQPIKDSSWTSEAKDWAGELISGQTTTGRILVVLVFLLSIASLIIYFFDASDIGPHGSNGGGVEKCVKWSQSPSQQLDLALNVFFAVYFVIRFIAAADKLWFMLELYSFVDYFTIPPSFVSLYIDRTW